MISDYLDRLGGALSFDRALAHRVRVEIEDHLREGMAADPSQIGTGRKSAQLPLAATLEPLSPSSPSSRLRNGRDDLASASFWESPACSLR